MKFTYSDPSRQPDEEAKQGDPNQPDPQNPRLNLINPIL
jgi:hypothetical protein